MASSSPPKTLFWLLAAGILAVVFLLTRSSCCQETSDETAIRELLEIAEGLAEKRAVGDLMELTTDDFSVSPRGKNRREVKRLLFGAFMRYGDFSLYSPRAAVEIDPGGRTADVTTHYLLVKSRKSMPDLEKLVDDPERWLARAGEMANLFRLDLHLLKRGGRWLFAGAVFSR